MSGKAKTKPLSHLRDKTKGPVHHITIHPARNSSGGQGFITRVHRDHPTAMKGMQGGGPFLPLPEPQETVHEDGQDMLQHVGGQLGVQPEAPETNEEE